MYTTSKYRRCTYIVINRKMAPYFSYCNAYCLPSVRTKGHMFHQLGFNFDHEIFQLLGILSYCVMFEMILSQLIKRLLLHIHGWSKKSCTLAWIKCMIVANSCLSFAPNILLFQPDKCQRLPQSDSVTLNPQLIIVPLLAEFYSMQEQKVLAFW